MGFFKRVLAIAAEVFRHVFQLLYRPHLSSFYSVGALKCQKVSRL